MLIDDRTKKEIAEDLELRQSRAKAYALKMGAQEPRALVQPVHRPDTKPAKEDVHTTDWSKCPVCSAHARSPREQPPSKPKRAKAQGPQS